MKEKNLTEAEIHVAVDVYNYIDSKGEMGANAESLVERYEDKIFLQKILNYFNEVKFVMKTGVCELTYVHSKHITPWVVNTYHLKRLERVSLFYLASVIVEFYVNLSPIGTYILINYICYFAIRMQLSHRQNLFYMFRMLRFHRAAKNEKSLTMTKLTPNDKKPASLQVPKKLTLIKLLQL